MGVREEWGLACPSCGSDEGIKLEVSVMAHLSEDGTEPDGDHEWDDNSFCFCRMCQFDGKVSEFDVDPKNSTQKAN